MRKGQAVWDPRFPELAAARLQERQKQAAAEVVTRTTTPGAMRRRLGGLLVRLGERLAAPASSPSPTPAVMPR